MSKTVNILGEEYDVESTTYLDLSRNKLTKLPSEIGKLSNLEFLDLSYNQLTELPKEIFLNLRGLEKLYLEYNNFNEETAQKIFVIVERSFYNCELKINYQKYIWLYQWSK